MIILLVNPKAVHTMTESKKEKYELECPLAHELIGKLSVIVGNCELLADNIPQDSPQLERTLLIREMAKAVAKDLGKIECDLLRLRTAVEQKARVL